MTPFLGEANASLEKADVAILSVPYEGAVSYGGGAANGPSAILEASTQVELYDETLNKETIRNLNVHTLPPLDVAGLNSEELAEQVRLAAKPHVDAERFLATLGGDHSISIGVLRAYWEKYGDQFTVLQFDAHADMREEYDGNPLSHACVMRQVYDMGIPFVSVGIRSLSAFEKKHLTWRGLSERIFWAKDIQRWNKTGQGAWLDELTALLGSKVYITFDVDAMDPAIMPATGTPEPGGLDWYTVNDVLDRVCASRQIIGCDINELAPIPGLHAPDFLCARLLYRILGLAL
ncbi:putative agmatinase [Magnetofaba australis IT-1]|uniref:Putative agmatinase n=1 Tax=Magnetofaba australis IT-1 TaxID=1434232 RepID=A0A1Y2JZN6_9PROT|nr:putative agmatinase [Magnetofaba australis IT-1]